LSFALKFYVKLTASGTGATKSGCKVTTFSRNEQIFCKILYNKDAFFP
jgi:hypothetical protein